MPKTDTPQVIERGQVVGAFMDEMFAAVQELRARREFDENVSAFLKEKGLVREFDSFREARKNPVQKKRKLRG